MTKRGAKRLQAELAKLRHANPASSALTQLEQILDSATIVEPPQNPSDSVAFGATVILKLRDGSTRVYRIVGVDELDLEPNAVSWISPLGKALLASELGQRIILPGSSSGPAQVVGIEYEIDE